MKGVFIGGISHSGTSILRKCIKEHPQITGMEAELRVITDPDGFADAIDALSTNWTRHKGDRAVSRLNRLLHLCSGRKHTGTYKDTNFEKWLSHDYRKKYRELIDSITDEKVRVPTRGWETNLDGPTYFTHRWYRREIARKFGAFIESLYEDRAPSATHFVEDTPDNFLHIPTLSAMFGGAHPSYFKFIHIVRHPMDNMHSLWNTGDVYGKNDPVALAQRNRGRMERFWFDKGQIHPARKDDVLEIRFEDFVRNHEQILRQLCDFIDIPWTDEMLNNRMDPERAHIGRYDGAEFQNEDQIKEILEPIKREYSYEW